MSEYTGLLERASEEFAPPDLPLDGVLRGRDRRRRNQRVRAAVLALLLAAAAFGYAVKVIGSAAGRPASITPKNVASLQVAWTAGIGGLPAGSALNRIANPRASYGYWPNPILWAPAASGDTVIVAAHSGTLRGYPTSCGMSAATCPPTWVADAGGSISWAPTVSDGVVYVATDNGKVVAFPVDCGTGGATCRPSWVGSVPNWSSSSPVVAGGIVYVMDHLSAKLFAFPVDCSTTGSSCSPLWVAQAGKPWSSTQHKLIPVINRNSVYAPVASAGVVYVIGITHQVYAFDATTGAQLWVGRTGQTNAGLEGRFNYVVASDGLVFMTAWTGSGIRQQGPGELYAFQVGCATGGPVCRPLWTARSFETAFAEPAVANGAVYVGSYVNYGNGHVSAYPTDCRPQGGVCDPLWVARAGGEASTYPPMVAGGHVYMTSGLVGYTDAFPQSCRAKCRPDWRAAQISGQRNVTQQPIASGGLVFTANGPKVRAFDQNCGTGDVACQPLWTWRAPSGSGIVSTPAEVGGELVVATSSGRVYSFTPGGVS